MLRPWQSPVADVTIVLASSSPRRLALLQRLGVVPVVQPADVDETPRHGESAQALAGRLAVAKVDALLVADDVLVIAADTVVVLDGVILGKPDDHAHATQMLHALSGKSHAVLTGVAVRRGALSAREVVRTEVTFRHLSTAEIDWYVGTGEPMGKAGGYALQGGAGAFVTNLVGSDSNVIGLPLATVVHLARQVGVDLLVAENG